MASAVVPPINAMLLCDGLKLSDLPVERIAPHGDEELRCRVHAGYDTAGNIAAQAWGRVLLWGRTFTFKGAPSGMVEYMMAADPRPLRRVVRA